MDAIHAPIDFWTQMIKLEQVDHELGLKSDRLRSNHKHSCGVECRTNSSLIVSSTAIEV